MKKSAKPPPPALGGSEISAKEIPVEKGEAAMVKKGPNGELKFWEDGTVNKKPRFLVASKSVINTHSDFKHKLLCDGLTFTAGHACAFSCSFCYVAVMMRTNANLIEILKTRGLKHEDVVVEIEDAAKVARESLMRGGKPRYPDPKDNRVIYASPLVDVAGNMDQVKVTVDICRAILDLTGWHIRLLSKSSLLLEVAKAFSEPKDKKRMIYGFSTGTLESDVTHSFEFGTALVSKRLEALKRLQDDGFRTFGMLCPILPQKNYDVFAKKVEENDFSGCEHVWAEVLNSRGDAWSATSSALRKKFPTEAALMDKVGSSKAEWAKYAEQTFLALTKVIPPKKLRFLQYVQAKDYPTWKKYESKGAVLLGRYVERMDAVMGTDLEVVKPLSGMEKQTLNENVGRILANTRAFFTVGLALKVINDGKLYRETHSSFEAFCLALFDFGRAYGYRLIKAADAVQELKAELSPIGDIPLTSESQVRELLKVKKENRAKVLKLAAKLAGDKPLNALLIESAAFELCPGEKTKPPSPVSAKYVIDRKAHLDWLANLKVLAEGNKISELLQLLIQAEAEIARQ